MVQEFYSSLPANTRTHPEPHVPLRGEVRTTLAHVGSPDWRGEYFVRREGPYLVWYRRPFFLRMEGDLAVYSLALPVVATWERVERSVA